MKFGKSLSNQIEETLPEWRDKFLSYKDLKKKLKLLGGGGDRPAKRAKVDVDAGGDAGDAMTREEEDFVKLLEAELEKFNAFFVEKEEEYIIRQKVSNCCDDALRFWLGFRLLTWGVLVCCRSCRIRWRGRWRRIRRRS